MSRRWLTSSIGLASFSRLILFDKRGTGLSDRVPEAQLPTLESRMADVLAVCEAAGSSNAALIGTSEGAAMCCLFAATYPARTSALVLLGAFARRQQAPDYPFGIPDHVHEAFLTEIARDWGGPVGLDVRAPSRLGDQRFRDSWARYLRSCASPGAAVALTRMNAEIDIRPILPAIRVPTLVVHRTGDRSISVEAGRDLAKRITGARFVEVAGDDHLPWVGDADAVAGRDRGVPDRGTTRGASPTACSRRCSSPTSSTRRGARPLMGDAAWAELSGGAPRARPRAAGTRRRPRGRTAGDGFLATFDGPARAVRCAVAILEAVRPLDLELRAGVHTGEVELAGDDIRGLAVHIGARIAALAGPGEVLVSRTVRDLVAGSGLVVRGSRQPHPQGRPRRVAAVRCRIASARDDGGRCR